MANFVDYDGPIVADKAPAAMKFVDYTGPISADKPEAGGPGIISRAASYLKDASANQLSTTPDTTTDAVMPKPDQVDAKPGIDDWKKAPTPEAQKVLDGGDMPGTRGLALGTAELGKTTMMIGAVAPVVADIVKSAFTGKTDTSMGDAYFANHVDKYQAVLDQYTPKPDEHQSFADKIGVGLGQTVVDLASMVASGGLAAEGQIAERGIQPLQSLGQSLKTSVMAGFDSARPVMVKAGQEKASEVLANGGSVGDATRAATTTALWTGYTMSAPMSLEGQAYKRVLTGLPVGSLTTEMSRQINNISTPDHQQPFSLEDNMVGATSGALLAGVMGHGPHDAPKTREQLGYPPTTPDPTKVADVQPVAPAPGIIGGATLEASIAAAHVPDIDPTIIQRNADASLAQTTGIASEMSRIRALRTVEPEPVTPEAERPDLSTPADIHAVDTLPAAPADGSRPDWEATVTPDGMAVRPRDNAADQARVDEFNRAQTGKASLGEGAGLHNSVPIKISDRPDTPQIAVARGMADLLGTHLVVVEGVGSETPFNGVNFHGDGTGKTIFVSADSQISALSIFGHEVGHDFQSQFPELYGKAGGDGTYGGLLGVLHPMIGEARIAERQALYEKAGKPISHEQALGEIVNDMLGNRIGEKTFWNYVGQRNVGVFQKLATVVKATLARVKEGLASFGGNGENGGSGSAFGLTLKQLEAANGHIDQAMARFLDDATAAKVNTEAEHMAHQTPEEKLPTPVPESGPGVQHGFEGKRIQEVPLQLIKQSKDVPQFKDGANADGVVDQLGGKFDRTGVAPIQLWKRLNGDLEVISGRHRTDLARRSGEKTIPAQIHHEAEGMTAKKASALDSTLNIRDGQGKVLDYVNYFKANELSRADADAEGLTSRVLGRRAHTIASEGSDSLVAAHRAGQLTDEGAVAIAEAAPGDERLQAVGIRAIQEGKTIAQAGNLVRAVKLMASERPDSTGDMFGFDDSGMREAEAMAKAATSYQRELQNRIGAISGAAKRPDIAKQEGIKVGDSVAILRRVDELKAEKIAWDNWPTNPELVAKIRADLPAEKPAIESHSPAEPKSDDFAQAGSAIAADADKNQNTMFSVREDERAAADDYKTFIPANLLARVQKVIDANPKENATPLLTPRQAEMARDQLAPKMAEAEKAKPAFDAKLTAMAKSLGADVKLASVKGGDRLLEKHLLENQGDPDQMRDLVRGSIVVDSLAEVPAALDRLKADFDVTRIKDRFAKPLPSGYSDILANVRLPGGLEAEVQIHIPEMIAGKKIAHKIYDVERKLPGNHPQKQGLLDLQSKIYDAAREANDLRTAPGSSPDSIQARKATGDSTSAMSNRDVSGQGDEGRDGSPGKNRTADVSGKTTTGRDSESKNLDPAGTAEKSISSTSKSIVSTKSNPPDFSVRDPRTETPEFKKWFGDWADPKAHRSSYPKDKTPVSRVVDASGRPLVLYHATNGDISTFETGRPSVTSTTFGDIDTVRHAIFATPDVKFSEEYLRKGDGKNVMPVYMDLKSPADMRDGLSGDLVHDIVSNSDGKLTNNDFRGVGPSDAWQLFDDKFGKTVIAAMKKAGYDGAIMSEESPAHGTNHDSYVAFEPSQIKSATGNNGAYDPKNPDIRYSLRDKEKEPPFYSALSREVEGIGANAAPAAGWKQAITGLVNKGKVKADEVHWSGVNEWLDMQQGKVTKQQVADYLDANGVKVTETTLGGAGAMSPELASYARQHYGDDLPSTAERWLAEADRTERAAQSWQRAGNQRTADQYFRRAEEMNQMAERLETDSGAPAGATKYSDYTLPGGKNYREVLLTLPERGRLVYTADDVKPVTDSAELEQWSSNRPDLFWYFKTPDNSFQMPKSKYASEAAARAEILNNKQPSAPLDQNYQSSHFAQPNILAHLRLNDRTDADGKRVLFVEEAQSDWGQEGKKKGFDNEAKFQKLIAARDASTDDAAAAAIQRQINDMGRNSDGGVPSAPFVGKTDAWLQLALKRVVKMATDEGYDRVAFVNGQQSADRYSLAKQIDRIDYNENDDGSFNLSAIKGGAEVFSKEGMPKADLEGAVGKEVARKMIDGEGSEPGKVDRWEPEDGESDVSPKSLSGLDLQVGGEGMKTFYDKILPNAAKDVIKKLGGEGLREVKITDGQTQTGFDITPAMKEKTAAGIAHYSLASTIAGVKFPGNKLLSAAESRLSDLIDHGLDDIGAYGLVAPMSAGTQKTRALAQEYANQERLATHQWGQMETAIVKHFDDASRTKMWNAADEQNELMQQNLPTAGKGLDRLNPEERAAVDQLHNYGEELMLRAKAVGMFKGDGVPYWTPRMAVMLDANGDYSKPSSGDGKASSSDGSGRNFTTSASSLKQRKYLTSADTEAAMKAALGKPGQAVELVRDIRTMPLAMQKLERAIAGRELVNQIKVLGKQIGKTLVSPTAAPQFFTIDHPAFTTFAPRMGEDASGKYTALKDDQGNVIMDKKPIYISKEFEGPLKAILSQQDGAIYRGYMLLKSKAMSAIMVSPLTHNMVIAGRAFAYAGLKLPALYFTGHGARLDPDLMTNAISHGMVPISGANHSMVDVGDIARGFGKDGGWGDPNESWIGLGAKAIGNRIVPGMGSGMKRGIDAAGDFWHGTLLWNRIGDLQAGIFKDANNKGLAKGLDANAAATYAASVANRYAGAVGRENMSAIARKMANVVLFSRSFNMGNIGAVKDVFYGMPAGLKAQMMEHSSAASAELGMNMAKRKAFTGLVTDLAATVLITSVTQDWIRRHKDDPMAKQISDAMGGYSERVADMWHNIKDSPGHLGSYDPYRLSSTWHNEPGKTDRVDMGAQASGRHEYMRLPTGKVVEDTIGWLTHAGDTFVKKMSPMAKAGADIAMNNKGFGVPVWDESGTATQKAMDIALHLVQAQLPYDSVRTGADMAAGVATPLDKEKLAGNLTGLSISQGHPSGPEGALAARVEERVKASKAYAMEEVKRSLKYGDDNHAREVLERTGMTPREVNRAIQQIESPKPGMSRAANKKFNQHANDEERASRAELER